MLSKNWRIAMNASDIMTPGVISADPDATVLQAARYMLQHHISGVPIIDKNWKAGRYSVRRRFFASP